MMRREAGALEVERAEVPPGVEREIVAGEVGAAIAHQLNGPLTALLLYLGDLYHGVSRLPAADDDDVSLKRVAENALREAESVCALIQRIGDASEAPFREQTAFARGRDIIRWWARTNGDNTKVASSPMFPACSVPLTARECEVLSLVREGCSNKEGAARLQISHRTFESHRARLMRKYSAKNVAALLRSAAQNQERDNGHGSGANSPGKNAKPKRTGRSNQ
jgi:DNA-binding CsgD family transcriptional regulator